jgi:hypothetical protein
MNLAKTGQCQPAGPMRQSDAEIYNGLCPSGPGGIWHSVVALPRTPDQMSDLPGRMLVHAPTKPCGRGPSSSVIFSFKQQTNRAEQCFMRWGERFSSDALPGCTVCVRAPRPAAGACRRGAL